MYRWLSGLVILMVFIGCKKKAEDPVDLGYNYFPNTERWYIIYNVDSISYGLDADTFHYQIKELNANTFIDDEGSESMVVSRYIRNSSNAPWTQLGNWSQKRTSTTAERFENNIRTIVLAFPLSQGKSWKGNVYNQVGDWTFQVDYIDQPADLGFLDYTKTLKVNQRNNVNLVDQEIAYDIYARDAGLVYRKRMDINTQPGSTTGYDVVWRAVATGYE